MLDAILKPPGDGAAAWHQRCWRGSGSSDGPAAERVGPYVRRVVSRASDRGTRRCGERSRVRAWGEAAHRRASHPLREPTSSTAPRALRSTRRDEFARLIALELGKPIKDGRGEMDRVGDTLRGLCRRGAPDRRRAVAGCGLATRHRQHGDDLPGTGRSGPGYHAVQRAGEPSRAQAWRGIRRRQHHDRQGAAAGAGGVGRRGRTSGRGRRTGRSRATAARRRDVGAALCEVRDVDVISFTGSAATGARRRSGSRCQTSRSRAGRQRRDHRLRRR